MYVFYIRLPNWRSFACVFHVFEDYRHVRWGVCISPAPDHILRIRCCYQVTRARISIECHFKRWTQFSRRCTRCAVTFFVWCAGDHEIRWQPTHRSHTQIDGYNARIIILIIIIIRIKAVYCANERFYPFDQSTIMQICASGTK